MKKYLSTIFIVIVTLCLFLLALNFVFAQSNPTPDIVRDEAGAMKRELINLERVQSRLAGEKEVLRKIQSEYDLSVAKIHASEEFIKSQGYQFNYDTQTLQDFQ